MPGIVALVAALSDAVVTGLNKGGQLSLCPLPDGSPGKILLGKQHDYEHADAPRIIFTPVSSTFGPKDVASPFAVDARHPAYERVIGTETVTFEVRCWGRGVNDATGSTSPDADYDATQALYQCVAGVVDAMCLGCYDLGSGVWTDVTGHVRRGREFVFQMSIATPVYARLALANPSSPVPAPTPPANYANPEVTNHGGTVVTINDSAGKTGSQTI